MDMESGHQAACPGCEEIFKYSEDSGTNYELFLDHVLKCPKGKKLSSTDANKAWGKSKVQQLVGDPDFLGLYGKKLDTSGSAGDSENSGTYNARYHFAAAQNAGFQFGADDTQPCILYVGNLDASITEKSIKTQFGQIGRIVKTKVIFDTGSDPYAFVEFADHMSASQALQAMNKRMLLDKEMKVNWATQPGSQQNAATSSTSSVHPSAPHPTASDPMIPHSESRSTPSNEMQPSVDENVQLPASLYDLDGTMIRETEREIDDRVESKLYEDMSSTSKAVFESNWGNEAYKKRDFNLGHQHYDRAIELDPTNITFYNNKAAAFFEEGKYDSCIALCTRAVDVAREPPFADRTLVAKAYARIANAYLKKDNKKQALFYFAKSLSEHRDNEVVEKHKQLEKELAEEAQKDPEIQDILRDPPMSLLLEQMSADPKAAREHLKNPDIMQKLMKLKAAGIPIPGLK
ncbi:hypothetical protein M3Y99_01944400 [Aphelenchoides fujianensis]|nr:hypothetical protein M3Y99_01944400 [Aphelenchoides fujianensis]